MRQSWVKRGSAWLLVLASLLALAGCGAEEGAEAEGGYAYVPEYLSLPEEITDVSQIAAAGERVYFTASHGLEGMGLYAVNLDGTELTELYGQRGGDVPEGMSASRTLSGLCVDGEGNVWVLESAVYYTATGSETDLEAFMTAGSSDVMLRKLSAAGEELAAVSLSDFGGSAPADVYSGNLAADSGGNLYVLCGDDQVFVLSSAGEYLFALEGERYIRHLVALSDGTVAAVHDNFGLNTVDVQARDWGTLYELPYQVTSAYSGGGDYLYYYTNGSDFFGYNPETGAGELLFNWLGCDVDYANLRDIAIGGDGQIVYAAYGWSFADTDAGLEMGVLRRASAEALPQRTVLTLATLGLSSELMARILAFNKSSGEYRIEVVDYSQYNTDENPDGGLTVLTTEITAGRVPDLLDMSGLSVRQYAGSGLLEDLYPYLDADAELSRAHILPNILAALEVDGALYQAAGSFQIETAAGLVDTVGSEPGWTIAALLERYAQMPEGSTIFGWHVHRDTVLEYCLALDGDSFVDWETGTCSFDAGAFLEILEFAALFPSQEAAAYTGGEQLLELCSLSSLSSVQMLGTMMGGEWVFKGLPTQTGVGSLVRLESSVAMTTACADAEGAWQFLRTLFLGAYYADTFGTFSVNQAEFDAVLADFLSPTYAQDAETGEYVLDEYGEPIVYEPRLTQEEADKLLALVEQTDRLAEPDENILAIVREEAAPYFAGQKTAEEAAALIQSRASLYVSEQR